jgi:hypothetical protein
MSNVQKLPNFMLGEQQGSYFCEKSTQKKFSTNEPIFTNNIPIDSAQQAETIETSKNFQNSFLGEQWGNFREKTTPWNNFSTVQPISTSNTQIDSAKQGEQNEVIEICKISLYGAREDFLCKNPSRIII